MATAAKYIRTNVWDLGADWADSILWYARGVKALKPRALDEPTSWRFYGAIHGFDARMWERVGYLGSSDQMPSSSLIQTYWKQCQHGSWYFLPWHRGYLMAIESVVRDAIVQLEGPDDWALPYWNYFKTNQNALPPAFASVNWPDGTGDNPLYVQQRYGPNDDGNVFVPVDQINLDALSDPVFTGISGGSPGFGGIETGFSHGGGTHGGIETQPHDWVHGLVGGGTRQRLGLMSWPQLAGLDPIFWLHHANIDRLWESWRRNPASHVDPSGANWINGPASIGEREFAMPMPDGSKWVYTPGELSDYAQLDYEYDDVSPPAVAPALRTRLESLGFGAAAADALERRSAMAVSNNVELLGASERPVQLVGTEARTSVPVDAGVQRKLSAGFSVAPESEDWEPDRVFLNLENVRGLDDSTAFSVYVNLPEGGDPSEHPENLAGGIALFGVSNATDADDEHAGEGISYVLEITKVLEALHLAGTPQVEALDVKLVPVRPVPEDAEISIGRISVFRQGR